MCGQSSCGAAAPSPASNTPCGCWLSGSRYCSRWHGPPLDGHPRMDNCEELFKDTQLVQQLSITPARTWLPVIPQMLARLNTDMNSLRTVLMSLLRKVGLQYPQAMLFPLSVARRSLWPPLRSAAHHLLQAVTAPFPKLMETALMVSEELINVSTSPYESWRFEIGEAWKLYTKSDTHRGADSAIARLLPMHERLADDPVSHVAESFAHAYGYELHKARACLLRYQANKDPGDMVDAWQWYNQALERLDTDVKHMKELNIQIVSPKLYSARGLDIAVPGTYRTDEAFPKISRFCQKVSIFASKRRPRKIDVIGDDGRCYGFLLKGKEDLKQDERVMQVVGLVNELLVAENMRFLVSRQLSVVPLAPQAGLIEWLDHSDTMHSLIKEHRSTQHSREDFEIALLRKQYPHYDCLQLQQQVAVFRWVLSNASGDDVKEMLWAHSRGCEHWIRRRVEFSRSLASMSVLGHVIGLGDRHPSNLLIMRETGQVVHIDLGDCFEVTRFREKYPEKVPFRLTRMLVRALGIAGVEGAFRLSCERVLRVLRRNKGTVMVMLEAFVHDPVLSCMLLEQHVTRALKSWNKGPPAFVSADDKAREGSGADAPSAPFFVDEGGDGLEAPDPFNKVENDAREEGGGGPVDNGTQATQYACAEMVLSRVDRKLSGTEFLDDQQPLPVEEQVQRLIEEATSHENQCQAFMGWCPFW
eukprot:GHVU01003626.1.p1 GENE.GHVU01003626.1~~GHVU01003626.1.p1  ORF type:complete len:700 (-),score=107.62 GHVU01003626.1:231-2330(-)